VNQIGGCHDNQKNEMARAIVLTSEQWFLQSGTENTDGGLIIRQLLLHVITWIMQYTLFYDLTSSSFYDINRVNVGQWSVIGEYKL
jgi:hypothetical protein